MGRARAQDLHLTAWGTARNAWTFLHQPSRIFDAEPCYPEPNSLTTDHPRLTLGLVGIPFQLVTGDPVATFNGVVFASVLLAAFAMYLLVADWTGVPAAGIVAAILYAFSTQQIEKTFHIMVTDNAWLLFALFFARRTLLQRRWRDAIALGITAALQVGSSVYALLGAAAGAIPVVAWLLWRHPPDRRPATTRPGGSTGEQDLAAEVLEDALEEVFLGDAELFAEIVALFHAPVERPQ